MNLRNLCPQFIFPVLQRIRSAKDILKFDKYKKQYLMEENKILLFSVSRESLSGNLLYIERAIDKRRYSVEVVLENDGTTKDELLKKLAMAQYIIIDDYTKMIYPLRMRKEAKLIQVWHSTGAFKRMGFARMGRKGSTIPTSLTHRNYTDVIVSSEGVVKDFAEAFGIDEKKIHPIGVPRTDMFFNETYAANQKENFYKKYPQLQGKKLVMFAPTFRGETREKAYYPKEFFPMESVVEKLSEEYVLGMKLHPFIEKTLKIPEKLKDKVIDFSDVREINDLLFVTDVLITDYSSVIFEYAFLKKPVIFYVPDLEEYIKDRDFFYPFEDYTYGEVIVNFEQLPKAIEEAICQENKLDEFYKKFLGACDGKASERFTKEIL